MGACLFGITPNVDFEHCLRNMSSELQQQSHTGVAHSIVSLALAGVWSFAYDAPRAAIKIIWKVQLLDLPSPMVSPSE